jgi:CheY-like chemotaxis protein
MQMDRLLYSKLIRSLVPSYNILTAENGQQALEVVKQFAPALIITDHQMPVMTGYDLAVQLNIMELKYRPPVIVLSSDVTKDIEAQYKGLGIEYIFQKPVNLSVFKISIEQALRKALSA